MSNTPAMRPAAVPVLDVKVSGDTPRIVDKGDGPDFDPFRDLPSGGAFETFRHIETRQELREACELLQKRLALGSEGRIPVTYFARLMLRAAWAAMKRLETGTKTRSKIPRWPDLLNQASHYGLFKAAGGSLDPGQFYFEARRRVLAAIDAVLRWCAGAAPMRRKGAGGRPGLKEKDLKLQVYERIRRERDHGTRRCDIPARLSADKDFVDQVRDANLTLNKNLVKNALDYFAARKTRQTPES